MKIIEFGLEKKVKVTKRMVSLLLEIENVGKGINLLSHNELSLGHGLVGHL